MSNQAGKGSKPRPYSVDHKTFDDNWSKTFSKAEIDTCAYSSLPAVHKYGKHDENTSRKEG